MQLEDFYDYKNQLMKDILTTESIVTLLGDNIDFSTAEELAYRQVFPCEYIPKTAEDGYTYICFDVDISSSFNKRLYLPTLYIWVFAHRSRLRLPNGGGVRTDKLCSEICKKINGSFLYGLGELELTSVKRFAPITDYQGKVLVFSTKEFSKTYNPHKQLPDNRKSSNVHS